MIFVPHSELRGERCSFKWVEITLCSVFFVPVVALVTEVSVTSYYNCWCPTVILLDFTFICVYTLLDDKFGL